MFYAPATTAIYTLSLHDALPIYPAPQMRSAARVERTRQSATMTLARARRRRMATNTVAPTASTASATSGYSRMIRARSEEHTSELQSLRHLVCRLLLEKKKNTQH